MAPMIEEPTQVDLDAPLKAAPKLVAPEPGTNLPAIDLRRPTKSTTPPPGVPFSS